MSGKYQLSMNILQIFILLVTLFFVSHVVACVFILIGMRPRGYSRPDVEGGECWIGYEYGYDQILQSDGSIPDGGVLATAPQDVYIAALSWSLLTLTIGMPEPSRLRA